LLSALLVLAAAPGDGPARAAQEGGPFLILFSDRADDKEPQGNLAIRPNVEQKQFVYVKNQSGGAAEVSVEVRAGGVTVAEAALPKALQNNELAPVSFAKKAADKQPTPPPPPQGKAAPPPPLTEVKGPLSVRLLDKDKKTLREVSLLVAHPKDYVRLAEPDPVVYDPAEKRLTVKLRAEPTFGGPPCRVDLVLRPDRITNLVEGPNKFGTRGGFLRRGGELTLTAEKLEFAGKGAGLFSLTIDGYERAFLFNTEFPQSGSASTPSPYTQPVFALNADASANPAAPFPVRLEVDNFGEARGQLVVARDALGETKEEVFDEFRNDPPVARFDNDRAVRLLLGTADPSGCLTIKPEVRDWSREIDFSGVQGNRYLLLRKVPVRPDEQILDAATRELTREVVVKFTLDASPPQGLRFVDFPEQLFRGDPLPVKAVARDDESQIQKVVFFLGKPGPDGKPPQGTVPVPGKLADKDKNLWAAALDAPTDQKAKLEVTVQATNGANLTASETVVIKLVDAPAGGVKLGTIEGDVVEGARKQPGVAVSLLDGMNGVRDSAATDDKGHYVFKDVLPGSYRVLAAKTTDNTRGVVNVTVAAGQKKTGVDIKLMR
jgi:hypothetical protein